MGSSKYVDLIGGCLLVSFGLFVSIYSYAQYKIGIPSQFGPGAFPLVLGCILAVLGLLVLVPALARTSGFPKGFPRFEFRPFIAVLGAMAGFGLLVDSFGMIPAVLSMTVLAVLADKKTKPLTTTLLAVILCALAVLVFKVGLSVPINIVTWPF